MPTPYEAPGPVLIEKLARHLKENVEGVVPPRWAPYAKTGSHVSRPPQNPEWWFTRCASILRKIYLKGPIGVQHLRSEYGGRIDRGMRPEHARRSGGSIIRKAIQQLEAAGLVEPSRNRGRVVTGEGRRLLDRLSTETKRSLEKKLPELKKY
ncbi:MAG: 30S ribosomal protein S19e [Candidatus Bathyarchaeota archaeon]|nr:MAG: 30S ribosomal protein S19e [Candidatus Bathyarchaeota archaeon]